ncbi:RNA 2',3'-cyclic phosphodiesterase [Planosporangium sp. 12N6]|uniref:RNA 2',3'-cyclic phosphodiesterase n=1 Tax=Planosporangium spinosum TaxID=3402278 RepID=UPI003CEB6571
MRLFVAAYPPPEVRENLAGVVGNLSVGRPREPGQSVRLAPPEHWHVTLAFLGDVPDPEVDLARSAVDRAVERWQDAGRSDARTAPVVTIAGGGTFGRSRFTTLWAGLRGDVDSLARLTEAVRRELRAARLPYDHKRFRPHLTIARPGDRITAEELAADLAVLQAYQSPPWTVADIRLVRSQLGPRPQYDRMHSVPLS